MRFAHLAAFGCCAFLCSVPVAGCSDTTPVPQKGAWTVEFSRGNNSECADDTPFNADVGTVTATDPSGVVTDGSDDVTVQCTVTGSSSFDVDALVSGRTGSLSVVIKGISSKSTQDHPAHGSASFFAPNLGGSTYSSAGTGCDFWFEGKQRVEGGTTGKIWASFACDQVTHDSSICALSDGVIVFENCGTGAASE